jgi:hypothetical protein
MNKEEKLLTGIAKFLETDVEELLLFKRDWKDVDYITYTYYPFPRISLKGINKLFELYGLKDIILHIDGQLEFRTIKW